MAVQYSACQRQASVANVVLARPVIARTTANASNAKMMRKRSATWIDGLSSGRITCRTRWKKPAPNTSAASVYSCGMPWSPARKITITNAVDRHSSATTTAISRWFDFVGSSQMYSWSISPTFCSTVFR